MPTPFMHLEFAERLRTDPALDPRTRFRLEQEWPAFYLGNVAADYQIICDIPRENTHFYRLPPEPGRQAHLEMLARYPELSVAAQLPAAQAVFVAGYCFHLIQDLVWHRCVLEPFFLLSNQWPADRRLRFVAHNTLLTFLDQRAFAALPADAGSILASAGSAHWLPFADDRQLHSWRDLVSNQLQPGGTTETIAIYAARLKMTPTEFARNLNDPQWMDEQLFARAPLAQITGALTTGIADSVEFINSYFAPVPSASKVR